MPNLSAKAMIGVPFLLPPMSLQRKYHTFIEESARLVTAIGESNVHLPTSRDLLLPRLISGDLSVTEAERELDAAA